MWDARSGTATPVAQKEVHAGVVAALCFRPGSSSELVSVGEDGAVVAWAVAA